MSREDLPTLREDLRRRRQRDNGRLCCIDLPPCLCRRSRYMPSARPQHGKQTRIPSTQAISWNPCTGLIQRDSHREQVSKRSPRYRRTRRHCDSDPAVLPVTVSWSKSRQHTEHEEQPGAFRDTGELRSPLHKVICNCTQVSPYRRSSRPGLPVQNGRSDKQSLTRLSARNPPQLARRGSKMGP